MLAKLAELSTGVRSTVQEAVSALEVRICKLEKLEPSSASNASADAVRLRVHDRTSPLEIKLRELDDKLQLLIAPAQPSAEDKVPGTTEVPMLRVADLPLVAADPPGA